MPSRVVIRLKNARALEQSRDVAPREVIVYHWNRIFGALLLALLLLIGLIWGGRQLFKTSAETPEGSSEQTLSSQDDAGVEIPLTTTSPATESSGPAPTQAGEAIDTPPIPSPAVRPSTPQIAPTPATAAGKGKMNAAQPRQGKSAVASKSPATTILSKGVKRVHLTTNVANDEPVDTLGRVIPMNDRGLIRVFLFMETSGLKGQILFHDWYWKGKRMAHARIPVRQNQYNASSSKFIDRIMKGPWEVKVVDEKEKVLARAAFEVR